MTKHPMVSFRVVGYTDAITPVEAKREYHIGVTYPHKPKYQGVQYRVVQHLTEAWMDENYLKEFKASGYTRELDYNIFQLINCDHCRPKETGMIDERKAPGA